MGTEKTIYGTPTDALYYTTKAKVIAVTNDELTESDIQDDWLRWETEKVKSVTGKVYDETTVTGELHDGKAETHIFLDHYPVISLTAVSIDDTAQDLDNLWYRNNIIGFKAALVTSLDPLVATFTAGYKNVSISYTHGVPDKKPIAEETATLLVAIRALRAKGAKSSGGIDSEKYDKYNVKYGKEPYGGMISGYKEQIEENLNTLGRVRKFEIF